MIMREIAGRDSPPLFHGGSAREAFKASLMIGTEAFRRRIIRAGCNQLMAQFGVHQPMNRLPVDDDTAPDPCPDGHIQAGGKSLRRAELGFGNGRAIDIGIKGNGHVQFLLKGFCERIHAPWKLWRHGDIAVGRRIRVQIQRTKTADAERGNMM